MCTIRPPTQKNGCGGRAVNPLKVIVRADPSVSVSVTDETDYAASFVVVEQRDKLAA